MNKRDLQKQNTKKSILKTAKNEFIKKGFLNTATSVIAKKAGIAHGTLFVHFPDKDSLIVAVFINELKMITDKLHKLLNGLSEIEEMLDLLLDFIEKDESFFEIIAKELPYYKDSLRRQIFFSQGSIRGYFYKVLETGINNNRYKDVDITMTLVFLFGTIDYLLSNKKSIVKTGSVIKEKRRKIKDTFLKLIEK